MDFLDPVKQRRNRVLLNIGYMLIALAIGIATLVLLFMAYGFGIDKNGNVIQSGLVFFSSVPNGASIYIDGNLYKSKTDSRALLPSGSYSVRISAPGYRDWQRYITVLGGSVEHFDYPFLFPTSLKTTTVSNLPADPTVVSQSPDKRWVVLKDAATTATFTVYDLKNPTVAPTVATIPTTLYTVGDGAQSWAAQEWSNDNQHLLLLHTYTQAGVAGHEYIVLDRQAPEKSVNISTVLGLAADDVPSLFNKKYDQYYLFNPAAATVDQATLRNPVRAPKLTRVLAYKSLGSDVVLYVTDQSPTGKPEVGKVSVVLIQGQKTYTVRTLPAGATKYSLDVATYSNDWYVLVAANNDKYAYMYKDPQNQVDTNPDAAPVVARTLYVNNPTYVSFSDGAQYMMAENGQRFSVYDAETGNTYSYTIPLALDSPQEHATWMDNAHLQIVSGGKLVVFDYDDTNRQTLQISTATHPPFYSPDYKFAYNIAPVTGATPKSPFQFSSTQLTVTP